MPQRTRHHMIGFLFFLSGAAGLLYEVIWVRSLGVVAGSQATASQAVLSAYFAGAALGAWLLGRRGDQFQSPLMLYARLELGIGIAGLWSLLALAIVSRVAPHLSDGTAGLKLGVVAFASAAFAFLPSTIFMGATLPALVRALDEDALRASRTLATLYAVNALGAVVGALATAFALISVVGGRGVVGIAVAMNFAAAVGAFILGRASCRASRDSDVSHPRESADAPDGRRPAESRRVLLDALACAGFAGISFELAAIRALALSFDDTTYSFAVTVSAFLVSIVIGSAIARSTPTFATSRVPAATILASAMLALGIAGHLLSLATGLRQALLAVTGSTWIGTVLAETTTATLLVMPAAVSTSLVFCWLAPRIVRTVSSESRDLSLGLLANLTGCAVAPLVAGLIAIPIDGARGAARVAVIAL
ncbi:MAG TPA: fused MFS/spermidine synthase, partial [Anaeromyxobacteraceae bacterium]|nr:fused MFS/spermidine synthase [Anaeromyxobacteraceae bacterium]